MVSTTRIHAPIKWRRRMLCACAVLLCFAFSPPPSRVFLTMQQWHRQRAPLAPSPAAVEPAASAVSACAVLPLPACASNCSALRLRCSSCACAACGYCEAYGRRRGHVRRDGVRPAPPGPPAPLPAWRPPPPSASPPPRAEASALSRGGGGGVQLQGEEAHEATHEATHETEPRDEEAREAGDEAEGGGEEPEEPDDEAAAHGGDESGEGDGRELELEEGEDGLLRPACDCLAAPDGSRSRRRSLDLVVIILSSRHKELGPAKRRDAVRNAWAHNAALGASSGEESTTCSVRFLFVMGGGKRAHVWKHDILVLPVADGYRQLAHKVLVAFEWVSKHLAFKYLFKTDDDSFVCLARTLEFLRSLPRLELYAGAVNRNHMVITKRHRWADREYVTLFNRTVYPPYMQGAGYILSYDLVAVAVKQGVELSRHTAIEDALVGTLLEGSAKPRSMPLKFRHKTSSPSGNFASDYALVVCERDTEFLLLHKLSVAQLEDCKLATQRRRSARCPQGPCNCRSLGHKPLHQRRIVLSNATVVVNKGRTSKSKK